MKVTRTFTITTGSIFWLVVLSVGCLPERDNPWDPNGINRSHSQIDAGAGILDGYYGNGGARGKFCNNLNNTDGSNLNLMLIVGNAQLSAETGKCSPCQNLPAKDNQAVELWFKNDSTAKVAGIIDIKGSREYIFIADLDDNKNVTIKGGEMEPKYKCATYDPFKDSQ